MRRRPRGAKVRSKKPLTPFPPVHSLSTLTLVLSPSFTGATLQVVTSDESVSTQRGESALEEAFDAVSTRPLALHAHSGPVPILHRCDAPGRDQRRIGVALNEDLSFYRFLYADVVWTLTSSRL